MKPTDTPWTTIVVTLCWVGMFGLLACMGCGKALWWVIRPVVAFLLNTVFLAVALVSILILIPLRRVCRSFNWDIDRSMWIRKGLDVK